VDDAAERIAVGFVEAERQRRRNVPGAEVVMMDGLALCFANVPAPELNGALVEREPSDAAGALAAAESEYHRRALDFGINLQVGRHPGLDDGVRAAGLVRLFGRPGLAARVAELRDRATPDGCRIEGVVDERGADGVGVVDMASFEDPPEVAHGFYGRSVHVTPDARWFVAWQADEPVGMAAAHLHAGAVGVFGVGVVPHARRRGLGAALTLAAARAFPEADLAWLHPSEMARHLYEQIGFARASDWEVWSRSRG
jgi:ribosomal protein S18 acetylase RimI-like enzyme